MNALSIAVIILTVASGISTLIAGVALRASREKWRTQADLWHIQDARRVLLQVEYADGKLETLADVPAGPDENSVRAIDHAIRDLAAVTSSHSRPRTA